MKIGIIKEYKNPSDIRVPLTPSQCVDLQNRFEGLSIVVEPYAERCFTDNEYKAAGIVLQENLEDCDVLIGVKEVPKERLIPNKTYFFFSHTIKEQAYNRSLLQTMLAKKIRMIDYEPLTDDSRNRIIGFGRWAGIVGAHYALLMLGKKTGAYHMVPANKCADLNAMLLQYKNVKIPAVKIALTGDGRVGKGAIEILKQAGIKYVSCESFLKDTHDNAVYTILKPEELYTNKDGSSLDLEAFFKDGSIAANAFLPYAEKADSLINGMYWDYRAPRLFELNDINKDAFKIKIISDITCDVEGSVPITLRQTSIADPYIGIDRNTTKETSPFSDDSIDVMAVGNLPNELPRDASTSFGEVMNTLVIPELLKSEKSEMLERATVVQNGALGKYFSYLENYAAGK